jgi:NCS1 family nucleobase:cation symporter-1
MLKAIFPSTAHIPNHLPESANITTTGLMCYFLFWFFQFPFLLISPQKVRWLFLAKAIIVPPAFLAMMGWAFATTGGGAIFSQKGSLHGSKLAWAWLAALNSTLGNFCKSCLSIGERVLTYRSNSSRYQFEHSPLLYAYIRNSIG